ncbi:hypothetical protein FE697_014570 [Mumia zhuanghuii]|uniref:Uncharacterized protein n=2 Tax=Mumia TaxID=1546255 RepID=A0ABW1QMU3_9ACTN|nr:MULTISPECIES: hypothetical protein [Mumia]KAA1422374.1 hypothetical protein FE697_014570 [Mumia zhuanghuii]
MSPRGNRRLARALRPKRTRAETVARTLLLAGAAVIVIAVLPIGRLRAHDGTVLLAGLVVLAAWAIVDCASASRSPDESPRWFRVRRIALLLSHGGFVALWGAWGALVVSPDPLLWLWAVGVIAYVIGETLEGGETRAERARQRPRDRERWADEHRRREATRLAAAEAERAAEGARTEAAMNALHEHQAREASRVARAEPSTGSRHGS